MNTKPQVTSITLFVAEYQKMYIFAPINVNFDPFFLHFGLFCFVCVISSTATNTNDRLRIKVDLSTAVKRTLCNDVHQGDQNAHYNAFAQYSTLELF